MPDKEYKVSIKAQVERALRNIKSVGTAADKTANKVKNSNVKITQSYKKMTRKVSAGFTKLNAKVKQHRAALLGLGLAVGLLANKAVKSFAQWEDGLAQIRTLGVKDIGAVSDSLDDLRKTYGITGEQATKAYYDIISAGGKEGVEAMERLEAATKLAVGGATELTGAVDILTSGINVFGDQGETAISIADKLFLAVKFGKVTVGELTTQFGQLAPVLDLAGLGMDEFSAGMATLTAGGMRVEEATTGYKAVINSIIKITPQAADAARELGLEFNLTHLNNVGFVQFMQEVADATGGSAEMMAMLFPNIRAVGAASIFTSEGGLASMERNMNAMADSTGAASDAFELVQQTANFNFNKFSQSINIMTRQIGGALVPSLLEMVDVLTPIIDKMAEFIKAHPGIVKLTTGFGLLLAAVAIIAVPLAILVTALSVLKVFLLTKLIPALVTTVKWIGRMTVAMLRFAILNPVGLVITGFLLLTAVILKFRKKASKAIAFVVKFFYKAFLDLKTIIITVIPAAIKILMKKLRIGFNNIDIAMRDALQSMAVAAANVFDAVGLDDQATKLRSFASGISIGTYEIEQANKSLREQVIETGKTITEEFENNLVAANALGDAVEASVNTALDNTANKLEELRQKALSAWNALMGNETESSGMDAGGPLGGIRGRITSGIGGEGEEGDDGSEKMQELGTNWKNAFMDGFAGITGEASAAVANIQTAFVKGQAQGVGTLVKGFAGALSSMAGHSRKAFELNKKLQTASAMIDTYKAFTAALANPPGPPFSYAIAGVALMTGMAQVANIQAQTYSGRQFGGEVQAGVSYNIGENGPETVNFPANGIVEPNAADGGSAGGDTFITQNISLYAEDMEDMLGQLSDIAVDRSGDGFTGKNTNYI